MSIITTFIDKVFYTSSLLLTSLETQMIFCIAIFTLIYRLFFFPLQLASFSSRKRKKKLKRELDFLKERKKETPFKKKSLIRKEISLLYSRNKIIPFKKLLPFYILQMVVSIHFISYLYTINPESGLWFSLNQPDPLFLMPIIYLSILLMDGLPKLKGSNKFVYGVMISLYLMFYIVSNFMITGVLIYLIISTTYNVSVNNLLDYYFERKWEVSKPSLEKNYLGH